MQIQVSKSLRSLCITNKCLIKPLRSQVLPREVPRVWCQLVSPGPTLSPKVRLLHFSRTGSGVLTGSCSWVRRMFFLHVGLLQAIAAPGNSAWQGFSPESHGKSRLAYRSQLTCEEDDNFCSWEITKNMQNLCVRHSSRGTCSAYMCVHADSFSANSGEWQMWRCSQILSAKWLKIP